MTSNSQGSLESILYPGSISSTYFSFLISLEACAEEREPENAAVSWWYKLTDSLKGKKTENFSFTAFAVYRCYWKNDGYSLCFYWSYLSIFAVRILLILSRYWRRCRVEDIERDRVCRLRLRSLRARNSVRRNSSLQCSIEIITVKRDRLPTIHRPKTLPIYLLILCSYIFKSIHFYIHYITRLLLL